MKIGIISDVHSNLPALEAIVKKLKEEKTDMVVFLGDVVGYGANPNECCEIVKEMCDVFIMGNHDAGVLGKLDLEWFNIAAAEAIKWTVENLSAENRKFLERFIYTYSTGEFIFSHGSPISPKEFIYVFDSFSAHETIKWAENKYQVILVGHSHITLSFAVKKGKEEVIPFIEEEIELQKDIHYLINVGSVGQPRDGDPRGAYAILDTERKVYRTVRVEYDVEKAARSIWNAGLPTSLGERLFSGI